MQKTRDSKRKTDMKQIQMALELYRADCGEYPPPAGATPPLSNQVASPLTSDCTGSTITYMQKVPRQPVKDPDPIGRPTPDYDYYYYESNPPNDCYVLATCLETNDPIANGVNESACFSSGDFKVYSVTCR